MQWYLKNYANFDGRICRKEYWFSILLGMLMLIIFWMISFLSSTFSSTLGKIFEFFLVIYVWVVFIPSMSVTVRRLHDIGKSGWWMLIILVPFFGKIWLFILTVLDSTPGTNQYGENPKNKQNIKAQEIHPQSKLVSNSQNEQNTKTQEIYPQSKLVFNPKNKQTIIQEERRRSKLIS